MATLDTVMQGGDVLACRVRVVSSKGRGRVFVIGAVSLEFGQSFTEAGFNYFLIVGRAFFEIPNRLSFVRNDTSFPLLLVVRWLGGVHIAVNDLLEIRPCLRTGGIFD